MASLDKYVYQLSALAQLVVEFKRSSTSSPVDPSEEVVVGGPVQGFVASGSSDVCREADVSLESDRSASKCSVMASVVC